MNPTTTLLSHQYWITIRKWVWLSLWLPRGQQTPLYNSKFTNCLTCASFPEPIAAPKGNPLQGTLVMLLWSPRLHHTFMHRLSHYQCQAFPTRAVIVIVLERGPSFILCKAWTIQKVYRTLTFSFCMIDNLWCNRYIYFFITNEQMLVCHKELECIINLQLHVWHDYILFRYHWMRVFEYQHFS